MDMEIMQSIETRRRALYDLYDLPRDARSRAESLFARMELFGRECRSSKEFERGLATRTLGSEYNGLLVEFTAYVK
jgi:hypothetical protein